jgi:hypothetical protein
MALDITVSLLILFQPQPLNVFQNGRFDLLNVIPVPVLAAIALYISLKLPKSAKLIKYVCQVVMVIAVLFVIFWIFAAMAPSTNLPYAK